MKRFAENYLIEWKQRKSRKPLILRGARQTGKTYLVEKFGREHFERFLKIDFEFDADVKPIFENRSPHVITGELSLLSDYDIIPGNTLLFLDEIQACPGAIFSLRYFFEKMPELHVIAAGSLLDFTLQDFQYAMPVGRIEFLHLFPLSFSEFLLAKNPKLSEFVSHWNFPEKISESIHTKLTGLLRHFFFTGGMPEAAASWIEHENLLEIQRIQSAILTTMQNDFAKYGSRNQQETLQKVMFFVPRNMGKKVKYVNVDRDVRSYALKEAFSRLQMSRIINLVHKTDANGVPLEAEKNEKIFKAVFLDIGLVNRACGLKLINTEELITIYEGGLAEQFAGQELLSAEPGFAEPALYYWLREEKNANAEIDYLITHGTKVIPLEIKAGKTGTLKSMHVFLYGKKSDFGIRLNMDRPSMGNFKARVRLKNTRDELDYTLMSLPLYLAGQLPRIVEDSC